MTPRKWTWPAVMIVSVIAAGVSILSAIFVADNSLNLTLSVAAAVMFALCAVLAFVIGSKMNNAEIEEDEVNCLTLKKPGIEVADDDEIVPKSKTPKGKMPKGKMPKV